ncbi:MAG: sulfatase-like hydrolase/transferase [Muribaculaceae bacterium]|nr:sulfatase-like hydrolase/transferase [Muribaculaceae bacterium]
MKFSLSAWLDEALSHKRLWLLLFLLSVLTIYDIPTAELFHFGKWYVAGYLLGVGILKASIIVLLLSPLLKRRRLRPIAWVLVALYGMIGAINAVSASLYGFGITRKLMVVVAQTNPAEAVEFLPGLMSNLRSAALNPLTWCVLIALVVSFVFIKKIGRRCFAALMAGGSVIGCVFYISFAVSYDYGRTAGFMTMRIPKYALEVYRSERKLHELMDNLRPFPDAESVASEKLASNVIVVIGESASRQHLSLYGYHLPTSPRMDAMADSLFVFTNVIGSSSGTSANIERILTFKKDDLTSEDWYKYPLLIDLFKCAGYKCFWLSNQERSGLLANSSGAIASTADVVKYVGSENSEDFFSLRYDGALLPEVRSALADTAADKLIMVHLMGSHTVYRNRYPKEFEKFSAADELRYNARPWLREETARIVAEYDNSILYTDYVVSDMIGMIAGNPEPSVLIYFSDHGENVYDDRDFMGREERFVEVPFVIYANAAYRRQCLNNVERMEKALNLPVSTANVIYSLMTLTGTSYVLYDEADDFMSDRFVPRKRYVDERIWSYEK